MALTPVVLLPVLAIIVALVIIAALWAWWSGSSPAKPPAQPFDEQPTTGAPPLLPDDAPLDLSMLTPSADPLPLDDDPFAALGPISDTPLPTSVDPEPTVEILRVLRDRTNGDLIIEMEGGRYRALGDFTNFEKQRRFVGTVNSLARLAKLDQPGARQTWQTASAPAPATPPPPAPADTSMSLLGGAFHRRRDDGEEEKPQELSVAAQIEERLQQRLLGAPEFAHRSLHIHSTPDGGVRVEVDGLFYAGVSDVPDEQARAFIQDTIHLWEEEQ